MQVFTATELPLQRADWLYTLAAFHAQHSNHAEQGQCLVKIYQGYKVRIGNSCIEAMCVYSSEESAVTC